VKIKLHNMALLPNKMISIVGMIETQKSYFYNRIILFSVTHHFFNSSLFCRIKINLYNKDISCFLFNILKISTNYFCRGLIEFSSYKEKYRNVKLIICLFCTKSVFIFILDNFHSIVGNKQM